MAGLWNYLSGGLSQAGEVANQGIMDMLSKGADASQIARAGAQFTDSGLYDSIGSQIGSGLMDAGQAGAGLLSQGYDKVGGKGLGALLAGGGQLYSGIKGAETAKGLLDLQRQQFGLKEQERQRELGKEEAFTSALSSAYSDAFKKKKTNYYEI